ncbi:MAG: fructosamine kinase family protein [Gallionella sp.]
METKLLADISTAISDATHRSFTLSNFTPVRGGSINKAYRLEETNHSLYFLKLNDAQHYPMFVAEEEGLNAIAATQTIRVPRSITHGISGKQSYLVLEHLDLSPRGDAKLLGEQLAALHRCEGKCFGLAQDNFIGTTPQPNGWPNKGKSNWIDFWREQRLGFQLQLAAEKGYGGQLQSLGEKLLDTLPAFFAGYTPQPSLLHGDLWSGNHAFLADGTPVIFDPATYYGDRECDLAMTELFGGYPADFYAAYRAAYTMDTGYATRRDLYNLYHVLNHANLFGGGYVQQAEQMTQKLLVMVS